MPTSNSYDFTRTRDQLINAAFDLLGLKAEGQTLSSQMVTDAAVLLNMFIKTLPAGGISLWRYQDIVVFLDDDRQYYSIGPSGDEASSSYVKTELSVAGVALAATITVDSTTGMTNGDNVGIVLDSGAIQWTTGTKSGSVITLGTALTSAAAIDNHVYIFTSKPQRPLRILAARLKINDGNETPVNLISREEYFDQPTKTATGKISQFYYNPTLTNGTLYVWPTSSASEDTLHLTAQRQLQDLDSGTDNLDFPQEWELALTFALADLLVTSYGDAISPQKAERISAKAAQYMEIVEDFDMENASIQFVPV